MREKLAANQEALRAAGIPIEDSFAKARARRLREMGQGAAPTTPRRRRRRTASRP
jgi:hypothetical protein